MNGVLKTITNGIAKLRDLQGFRRMAVAFVVGLLAAFAFPPFHAIPVLWLCFPVLVALLQGATRTRQAFAIGWSFAFGQLVVCLYWIAASMFVDIKSFWWALPLAIAGLPACFAIYYGLASSLAHRWSLKRADGILFFAVCWFGAEMARAHLFTGFPWDMLGYAWGDVLPVMQSVSVLGIEGLTLVTLVAVLMPALYATPVRRAFAHGAVVCGILVFVGLGVAGSVRLAQAPQEFVPDVRMRLVQPSTDQALKWRAEQRTKNFMHLMDLTFKASAEKPITHIIWPETAVAYYLNEEPLVRSQIAAAMPKDSVLLTGVVRRVWQDNETPRFYNALIAMDSKGNVVAGYDKHHLVPFGEYMPYRSVLPIPVISTMGQDFSAGVGPVTIRVPNLPPLSGLVCYEAIFSGAVAEKEDPPQLLLNVTNDGWYKGTIGPAQHFAIVRARAIEEGLPLVRVANAGTTGVIDAYGRVIAQTGESAPGFVDSSLPKPLSAPTFMARHGSILGILLGIITMIFAIVLKFQRRAK